MRWVSYLPLFLDIFPKQKTYRLRTAEHTILGTRKSEAALSEVYTLSFVPFVRHSAAHLPSADEVHGVSLSCFCVRRRSMHGNSVQIHEGKCA